MPNDDVYMRSPAECWSIRLLPRPCIESYFIASEASPAPPQHQRKHTSDGGYMDLHPHLTGMCGVMVVGCIILRTFTGAPCDAEGNRLPPGAPPPPPPPPRANPWYPFESRSHFELADFLFRKDKMSGAKIDELMRIISAFSDSGQPPFTGADHVYGSIDSIPLADVRWEVFEVSYVGPRPDDPALVPAWMKRTYRVWFRSPHAILKSQLGNPDFAQEIDWRPRKVYNNQGERVYEDFMTGDWAWKQAVCLYFDSWGLKLTLCYLFTGYLV